MFALAGGLPAQAVEDLAPLLRPIRAAREVPALGVAVLEDGVLRGLGVDGVRKLGSDAPVTTSDLWHLGSCTKAMTATWLAMLVEDERLGWDTTAAAGLPDLRADLHESAAGITVARLLQHRAGIPASPPPGLWAELFRYEGSDEAARTDVARALLAESIEAPRGERFLYSNAGYMIAGAIGERAAGASWQQQLRTRLFAPLGMERVGFGPPGDAARIDQPWGHRRQGQQSVPLFFDNPSSMGPAGTVHASLEDWARFAALHLGVVAGERLLQPASLKRLHTPPAGGPYALGWSVTERSWAPGPVLTHSGSNTMWFCVAWLAPEARFAVLVTCNHGDGRRACDEVAAACIRRYRR